MSIKLVDTAVSMGNFPVAYADAIECSDGERLQKKIDDGTLGGGAEAYVEMSQEEYDALSDEEKSNGTEYRTYDTGRIYKYGVVYGEKKPIELTYAEYKALEEAGGVEADVDYVVHSNESGVLLSDLDTNHGDSEISTYEVIETLKSDVENLIDDTNLTSTTSTFSASKINTELVKKESVYTATSSTNLLYYAAVYLGVDPVQYGLYNVTVVDDKGNFGEYNFVYKHATLIYGYIISENGIILAGINNSGTLAVTSTSTYKNYKVKYLGLPTEDMTTMPNGGYTRENRNALASEIVGTKTQYRGSRSIDISTGGKLTLIYSSEYASQAGCYMLLSNYNTTPLLIELGRTNIGAFNVTATNKSFGVDTITVTTAGDEYSWCVLQF